MAEPFRDWFSGDTAPKAIFSVCPLVGFKTYTVDPAYDLEYVHWDEPARDYNHLKTPLENVRLRMKRDEFWGGSAGRTAISPAMTNPTWKDVLDFASKGIAITNDWHHVFLESISFSGEYDDMGRQYVDLWMGS